MKLALAVGIGGCCLAFGLSGAEIRVIHSGIVNDTIVNAQTPCGVAKDAKGNYITCFIDGGDAVAGSTTYFCRTANLGKTWRKPFAEIKPERKEVGNAIAFTQLPDGRVLGVETNVFHTDLSQEGFRSYRTCVSDVIEIDPNTGGKKLLFRLKAPKDAMCVPIGTNFVKLSNGDLLLPGYVFCYNAPTEEFPYGSGFFRSTDDGKTWSDFELIFREPDPKDIQGFNESTIIEKADGELIAYARTDTHTHTMWKSRSKDRGKTWSDPEMIDIPVAYPVAIKTRAGDYLMVAGYRKAAIYGTTTIFYSKDGENFTPIGVPRYSRPGDGKPYNSATGGGQAMIEVAPDVFLVVFYSADPKLPGRDHCYIDSCLFRLVR